MRNKTESFNQEVERCLLTYRTTSHSTTNRAPAELIFDRRLPTDTDIIKANLARTMHQNQDNMICHARSRKMRKCGTGEEVFVRNFGFGYICLSGVIVNEN